MEHIGYPEADRAIRPDKVTRFGAQSATGLPIGHLSANQKPTGYYIYSSHISDDAIFAIIR